jgi:hypothetical protein
MTFSSIHSRLTYPDSSLLLPSNLPIDELIFLTRKMACCLDGGLDQPERSELKLFLGDYLGLLVRMQSSVFYEQFLAQIDIHVAGLMMVLDMIIRDELVSRLIDYPVHRMGLVEAFNGHFNKNVILA